MQTLKQKLVTAGVVAVVVLAAEAHAQMGQMPGMSHKGDMGAMGSSCMMGPMKMAGAVNVNGKPNPVQCNMMPTTSAQKAGTMAPGKATTDKSGMTKMPGMTGMTSMKMDKPMKMAGTMTMMGKTYHCSMMMTPQGK